MKQVYLQPPNIIQPIFFGLFNVFEQKPIILLNKVDRWRKCADLVNLSDKARLRLEWMIFYETMAKHNVYKTAQHFNIAPKTFYKWQRRFDSGKVRNLEDQSNVPKHTRQPEITFLEEDRIKKLRQEKMKYGKRKLKKLYENKYQETISTHKIQKVINKFNLYPDKKKINSYRKKLKSQNKKQRIQKLKIKENHWFLFHLDTIVIYWGSIKRYILTAIDHHGKIGYARMYTAKSSRSAKDFLFRLHYLIDADIANVQTDNGSEFYHEFEQALERLKIAHWFSRPRTPKDNSIAEKFNQTLEEEWLNNSNFTPDCKKLNTNLTKWLEEYNFKRPHQTLDYQTPFEYYLNTLQINKDLLPMYTASANF